MSDYNKPSELVLEGNLAENFKIFKQQVEIYFTATETNKKPAVVQVALLLNLMGRDALKVYNTFNILGLTTVELILQEFETYCTPKRNEVMEHYKFFSRKQKAGEPFDVFMTSLKNLIQTCGFGEAEDKILRTQIVLGINNPYIQARLLREDTSLKKVIGYCQAAELAEVIKKTLEEEKTRVFNITQPRNSGENKSNPDRGTNNLKSPSQSNVSKEKDSYGNEVSRLGRPLPVDYLLLDVPASTPLTPQYTFNSDISKKSFPVENRLVDGHIQDFNALTQYMSQFSPNEFLAAVSDFHLLIYIATMDMLPMLEYMGPLLEAIKNKDASAALEWSRSEHWATVEQLIAATNTSPPNSRPGSVGAVSTTATSGSPSAAQWTCPFCTFLNPAEVHSCEMCSLPRSMPH